MADIAAPPSAIAARPNENARWRVIARNTFPFLVVFALWEIVARAGVFPAKLFPSLVTVAQAFVELTANTLVEPYEPSRIKTERFG